jgi:hypothetical protein
MKKIVAASLVAVFLASGGNASATVTSTGSLTTTGSIVSSISLTITAAGGTVTGLGTDTATSALGDIQKYGMTLPTFVTQAKGASNYTLTSSIGVNVDKANLTSTDYTLTAQLGTAPASGVTWKLNGSTLSDGAATTLTSTGAYASATTYTWNIVITDAAAPGAIDNAINFLATAN